jgi:hypothetical protein
VTTDKKGIYEIDLPKKDGWTVGMEVMQGFRYFRHGLLLDTDPSYRVLDEDERRALIEHTADADLFPVPVGWKRTDSKMRLDLIAVPFPGITVHPPNSPGPDTVHH